MIVAERATYRQAAVSLNAAGLNRRDGKAWDEHALRALLAHPNVTGVFTWADGKRATGKWGPPKTLTFPGVLSEDEHRALLAATSPGERKAPERRAYLLSGRITAPCGKDHGGIYRNDRDTRSYRCDGKRWRPDTPRCDCGRLDADSTEARVWTAVAGFLGDGERMNRIAADYLGLRDVQVTVERDELADVRRPSPAWNGPLPARTRTGCAPGSTRPRSPPQPPRSTPNYRPPANARPRSSPGKPTARPKPYGSAPSPTSPPTRGNASPPCPTRNGPKSSPCSTCKSPCKTTARPRHSRSKAVSPGLTCERPSYPILVTMQRVIYSCDPLPQLAWP